MWHGVLHIHRFGLSYMCIAPPSWAYLCIFTMACRERVVPGGLLQPDQCAEPRGARQVSGRPTNQCARHRRRARGERRPAIRFAAPGARPTPCCLEYPIDASRCECGSDAVAAGSLTTLLDICLRICLRVFSRTQNSSALPLSLSNVLLSMARWWCWKAASIHDS